MAVRHLLGRFWKPRPKVFYVKAVWDEGVKVWYVAETNVPGLSAEAGTQDELEDILTTLVPILLEENNARPQERDSAGRVPVQFLAEQRRMLFA